MRLCIADPPYLGRAAMLYGAESVAYPSRGMKGESGRPSAGDSHPDAGMWDEPSSHEALVARLCDEYDGWAIAMNPENLFDYLRWVPRSTRVAAWVRTNPFPAGHVVKSWEPVLLSIPARSRSRSMQARDSLVSRKETPGILSSTRLVGSKPPEWTRWVLDMLGYDPETDTVDDLFHGSGAVAREVAQGVLDL